MSPYERAAAAQRLGADPAASVFVTANAGSGKTKVLIDRIARLLLEGAAPSSFLCITYTKAAAAEMQRRLFERLGAWCVADDATLQAHLRDLTGDPAPQDAKTLETARALFARALESPGGLKIQTIHAFCERLLGRFPLEAGVAPGFDVADDARAAEMLTHSWAAVAREGAPEALEALARFAARLANDRFQALLKKFVDGRDLMAAFSGDRAALFARHGATRSAQAAMEAALAAVPWADLAACEAALREIGKPKALLVATRLADARGARGGEIGEAYGRYRSIWFKDDGDPYGSLAPAALKNDNPTLAQALDSCAAAAIVIDDDVRRAQRAEDAAAALVLARALDGAYVRAKKLRGTLDFADLIAFARHLLTRADSAPWVLYKLDGGLTHILIDEGQDTAPAQWALIEPLQAEFFAGEGAAQAGPRTMFAVGDPKQSIYSFQGAHPEGFLQQSHILSSRAAAAEQAFKAISLDMSFRSAPEVLQAVDETFARTALGADMPGMFDVVRHTAKREREGGRVEWWPIAPKPVAPTPDAWDAPLDLDQPESAPVKLAAAVAQRVKAWIAAGEGVWEGGALRPMHAGDVMILVRTRGPLFRQLLKALKRAGLKVAGADRMVLKDELAVEDCLSLLRVGSDPADDLALACLLKGPWIGLTDDDSDLWPLAHGRAPGESVWARLQAGADPKYAPARDFIRMLIDLAPRGPYATLSWALERVDEQGRSGWALMAARLGEEARDPVEELLARALSAHRDGAATLQSFLARIERDEAEVKREMEGAGDSVRIMTVHGAKGLEAPVVILPETTAPARTRYDDDLFFTAEGPVFSASMRDDDAVAAAARAAADAALEGEHRRLLYVAMTRACDRLIVCGHARGAGAGDASAQSWHTLTGAAMARIGVEIETPFGPGYSLGAAPIATARADAGAARAPAPDWIARMVGSPISVRATAPSKTKGEPPAFSPRGAAGARFRRGLLIHGLLQRLPDIAPDARAAAAEAWLAKQGAAAEERGELAREALGVLAHPLFARVFGPDSRAEAPIVGRVRGMAVRGIVDRLVVRDEEVLVLDFKSDRPAAPKAEDAPDGYVRQMALYRAVLQQIFPGKPVRCALVWTEKAVLTELKPGQMEDALAALADG